MRPQANAKCDNCGAPIPLQPGVTILTCRHCGSSKSLVPATGPAEADFEFLVPTAADGARVRDAIRQALIEGADAPDDVLDAGRLVEAGFHFRPAWLGKGTYRSRWSASFRFDRQESCPHYESRTDSEGRSGQQGVIRTRTVTEWRPASGTSSGRFSMLVLAGNRGDLPPEAVEGLEKAAPLGSRVTYKASLLGGLEAMEPAMLAEEAERLLTERVERGPATASALKHAKGDQQRDWAVDTEVSFDGPLRLGLIPVAKAVYEYDGAGHPFWFEGAELAANWHGPLPVDRGRDRLKLRGYWPLLAGALVIAAWVAWSLHSGAITLLVPRPVPLCLALMPALIFGFARSGSIDKRSRAIRRASLARARLAEADGLGAPLSDQERNRLQQECRNQATPWPAGSACDGCLILIAAILAAVLAAFGFNDGPWSLAAKDRDWGGSAWTAVSVPLMARAAASGDVGAQMFMGEARLGEAGSPRYSAEALRWFGMAARAGNVQAMLHLGRAYSGGDGPAKDLGQSLLWLERAAEAGDAGSIEFVGKAYHAGQSGASKDMARAVFWLGKAAEAGDVEAMKIVGLALINGDGVPRDAEAALKWLEKAAESGDAEAQEAIKIAGLALLNGDGGPRDAEAALEWLEKAAEFRDVEAQVALGDAYRAGQNVFEDREAAFKWYLLAAEQGNGQAMERVAMALDNGDGVPENNAEAVRWYERSAGAGSFDSQTLLILKYLSGKEVPRNEERALYWLGRQAAHGKLANVKIQAGLAKRDGDDPLAYKLYLLAAGAGDAEAMREAGRALWHGQGVERSVPVALRWYEKAAAAGDAEAMREVGRARWHGYGVEKSVPVALRWYEKAAAAGDVDSMLELGDINYYGYFQPKDHGQARSWYEKAAAAGSAAGNAGIGRILYGQGRYDQAFPHLSKGAMAGDKVAQCFVGQLFYHGRGTTQDQAAGRRWIERALAQNAHCPKPWEQ
jgi:TPR repeat protein